MAISVAVQRGTYVYVYNERNQVICQKVGKLVGYTGNTFTVESNGYLYTYNERGGTIGTRLK